MLNIPATHAEAYLRNASPEKYELKMAGRYKNESNSLDPPRYLYSGPYGLYLMVGPLKGSSGVLVSYVWGPNGFGHGVG